MVAGMPKPAFDASGAARRWADRLERRPGTPLLVSCLLLAALAWRNRFIQDDAFISFNYAAHLVSGAGLTWLPGERVEGYTNFLWTIIMSVPIALGIDPVRFSQVLGIGLFVGTLLMTGRLAATLLGSRPLALLTVWLVGTNYTFSAYATGGLETQLQTFLVVTALAVAYRMPAVDDRHTLRLLGLSLLCAAALLTRLDSAIPVAVLGVVLLLRLIRETRGPRVAAALALVLPALIIVAIWFAWRLSYYGDLLPNTFHAKTGTVASARQGIKYLLAFVESYWLQPFVVGLVLSAGAMARRAPRIEGLLAIVVLWCAYVMKIGGDFMEFRLLVPILPLLMILAVWMIHQVRPAAARVALVLLIVAGSASHAVRFISSPAIDSVSELARYVEEPATGWITAGRVLGEVFGRTDPPVVLATTAAGAIPFYSGLPTLDMHGLTDRRIARYGRLRPTTRPGHQRTATLRDLMEHRVNLVIGHPAIQRREAGARRFRFDEFVVVDQPSDPVPAGARFVIVPISESHDLTMLALIPHAAVDQVIQERGFETYPVER